MNPKLPRSFYLIALLSALLLWGVNIIGKQQAQLDARPATEDFRADTRTEDVRRGPSVVERHVKILPDGTKTIDSKRSSGAVETHVEAKSEASHKETPALVWRPTRYVGAALTPLDWQHPRISAGITTAGGRLDLGAYWDTARRLNDGAIGGEGRLRW